MPKLTFKPLGAPWTALGQEHAAETTINNPAAELVRLAGAAHAAGAIEVTDGLELGHVQSQEDGEAAYQAAQADGSWQEGNLLQAQIEADLEAAEEQA